MLTLSILILMAVLFVSVISIGIRMAWGATKFIFGLGLFWFCPLLFVLAVLFVLVLPAVICAGGTVWRVQPHLAADRNRRTAVRRWI